MQRPEDAAHEDGAMSGTLHSRLPAADRQDWGQVMRLSGVSSPGISTPRATAEHLSRSNSEGWELLHHEEPALAENAPGEGVQVHIEPSQDSVTLRITPNASPMPSPRQMVEGNGAASPATSPSPLSGSAHSFEHLSEQCAQPESPTAASVAGAVPSPPSLPDLEALHADADGDAPLLGSAECGLTGAGSPPAAASSIDGGNGSEACLEASFADQLQLAAELRRGSMPSMASSAVSAAAADSSRLPSEDVSPLGSSYSDLSDAPASHPVLQQALAQLEGQIGSQVIVDAEGAAPSSGSDSGRQDRETPATPAGGDASLFESLKAYLTSHMPSAALASLWETLQEWSHAVCVRIPALPPQIGRPVSLAGKRLQQLDWKTAALGTSVVSIAVLSALLYKSYDSNRKLKAMMGRKETDILQLISRVVSLQRDMLRPRAVPIIRHTSSGGCAWPMDIM